MKQNILKLTAVIFFIIGSVPANAQEINVVTTAVPFLRIAPDARAAALGDLGVATSPDANSSFWNLGKVPFNKNSGGISASYTPWLSDLLKDVYLAGLAGYYKLDDEQAISCSFRYFSLGNIQFTDASGQDLNSFRPREYGMDIGYSRKLSGKSGLGVGLKYIYSNLAEGAAAGNTYKAASSVAGDIAYFFNGHNPQGKGWAFGAVLSNLGGKISYTDNSDQKDFIPANLGIGTAYTWMFNTANKLMLGIDINKLLVSTPPADPATPEQLKEYRSKSVISSWFSSFSDAPNGFSEEIKEFQVSLGGEYVYNEQFAVRAGYFLEDKTKGNRSFFSMGVGVIYNSIGLDFSYLVPSGSGVDRNPLSNTLRFSLHFNFDSGNSGSKAITTN